MDGVPLGAPAEFKLTYQDLCATTAKIVQVNSCLESKLLVITSLDGGSGDKTSKIASIGGVGSARLHLRPLFRASLALNLKPRVLSLDVDHPSILNDLGSPSLCIIGKINHFDDSRLRVLLWQHLRLWHV